MKDLGTLKSKIAKHELILFYWSVVSFDKPVQKDLGNPNVGPFICCFTVLTIRFFQKKCVESM